MQALTLSQLNNIVRQTIDNALPNTFWVQAELAAIHENRGHCYMELVEKAPSPSGEDWDEASLVAQARACCWKNTWLRVRPKFEHQTGTPLHTGMKVLLSVRANFHEAYGFSWIVNDIDPTFTIGDMARRRQEILNTLREEGIIDLNKQLPISPFCMNIAVISSATAAGYGDFCNQLTYNDYGFQFHTRLFPAIMQGEQVESSIIAALNEINDINEQSSQPKSTHPPLWGLGWAFDAVVIIRGGGSTIDLSGFDTLALAENVANFPLPVITGIGHDRDQSVLDVVACLSLKTPTAVAAFLIDNLAQTLERLQNAAQTINSGFTIRKLKEENRLTTLDTRMATAIKQRILVERNRLMMAEQRTQAVDPINILKKGYSLTLHDGVTVKSHDQVKGGDELTIMFAKGVVTATVEQNLFKE